MSAETADRKEKHGYIRHAPKCGNCANFRFSKDQTSSTCTKGAFAVNVSAICNFYKRVSKEKKND